MARQQAGAASARRPRAPASRLDAAPVALARAPPARPGEAIGTAAGMTRQPANERWRNYR